MTVSLTVSPGFKGKAVPGKVLLSVSRISSRKPGPGKHGGIMRPQPGKKFNSAADKKCDYYTESREMKGVVPIKIDRFDNSFQSTV